METEAMETHDGKTSKKKDFKEKGSENNRKQEHKEQHDQDHKIDVPEKSTNIENKPSDTTKRTKDFDKNQDEDTDHTSQPTKESSENIDEMDDSQTQPYSVGDFETDSDVDDLMENTAGISSKPVTNTGRENDKPKKNVSGYSSDEYSEPWERPWKNNGEGVKGVEKKKKRPRMFKQWSDNDTREYRRGYPGKKDSSRLKDNLVFYSNKLRSEPSGDYIDVIHKKWFGDYRLLESHHGYIQWLFPIRERGMNFYSQELQLHEAEAIIKDPEAKKRVLKSYELMLDFYGMRLVDSDTGELERSDLWKERYRNLNTSSHNYLRITRILKSLGELGYEHLKAPFVEFVLKEALENKVLRNCRHSCVDYWVHVLRDDARRHKLLAYIDEHYDGY